MQRQARIVGVAAASLALAAALGWIVRPAPPPPAMEARWLTEPPLSPGSEVTLVVRHPPDAMLPVAFLVTAAADLRLATRSQGPGRVVVTLPDHVDRRRQGRLRLVFADPSDVGTVRADAEGSLSLPSFRWTPGPP